jgi:hypothetical protein
MNKATNLPAISIGNEEDLVYEERGTDLLGHTEQHVPRSGDDMESWLG